ncbi:unnamed protein product [Camellia sinensis]
MMENRAIKLPPGFRFEPTDEEIVFQYLTSKIFSTPLPTSVVPDILTLSNYDPWDLPAGDGREEDRYLFTKKEGKYQKNGKGSNDRTTSSGYWKATGPDKKITSPTRKDDLIGMRKTLVFHTGKPPNGSRTLWIMHEYRLVNVNSAAAATQHKDSTQVGLDRAGELSLPKKHTFQAQARGFKLDTGLSLTRPEPADERLPGGFWDPKSSHLKLTLVQIGNWVLCRIFLKKRSSENDDDDNEISERQEARKGGRVGLVQHRAHDFMVRDLDDSSGPTSPSSSSSTSSCGSSLIIEVTSNGL